MDPRGIAETVGAALVGSALAAVALWLFAGEVNWLLVVGIGAVVALASAASYRDVSGHADLVDEPRTEQVDKRGTDQAGERRMPDPEPPGGDEAPPPTESDR